MGRVETVISLWREPVDITTTQGLIGACIGLVIAAVFAIATRY